jgi:hypothetical protein
MKEGRKERIQLGILYHSRARFLGRVGSPKGRPPNGVSFEGVLEPQENP